MHTQPCVIVPPGADPISPSQTLAPTSIAPSVKSTRIAKAIIDVFKKYDYESLDLDALLFCTLQLLNTTAFNYEGMRGLVKDYILENFHVTQGKHLRPQDVVVRCLTIGYSYSR